MNSLTSGHLVWVRSSYVYVNKHHNCPGWAYFLDSAITSSRAHTGQQASGSLVHGFSNLAPHGTLFGSLVPGFNKSAQGQLLEKCSENLVTLTAEIYITEVRGDPVGVYVMTPAV